MKDFLKILLTRTNLGNQMRELLGMKGIEKMYDISKNLLIQLLARHFC